MNNTPNRVEFEHCVMCGKSTGIPISMPVDWRENYELGCGQLCTECVKKQQEAVKCENVLTNEQVLLAVEQSRKGRE